MAKVSRILVICVFSLVMSAAANAATFVVNTTNDTLDATPGDGICLDGGGQCSLRAAIGEANALAGDDIITLPAGTYTQSLVAANEDANAGGDWDITSNITINGAGAATTILQAAASPGTATERVMEAPLTTTIVFINGVTLRHGNKTGATSNTTRGGGIRNAGTLTLTDCIVTQNNATGAGGIRNERTATLNNTVVSNNGCNNGGTTCFGGGMYNTLAANSTVTINGSTFSNNTSTSPGTNGFGFAAGLGIESTTGFTLNISNSSFTGNQGVGNGTGGSNGNGIRMLPTAASVANITNTSFSNNTGAGGSAIQGVGIQTFTSGAGTLTGTWDGLTVNGNSGTVGVGVALVATGGSLNVTIRNSTISNNTSTTSGGGLIISNSGQTSGATSTVNVTNTTISGNTVNGAGGGVFVEQPSTGTIVGNFNFCTIANNRANNDNTGAESGGGIFRSTAGTVNLKNSVVGDNSVGTGSTGPDVAGAINSQDYNHIEDASGGTIGGTTTNNTSGDAGLGPLADNGGSTLTHLPGGGSPVLNSIPNGTNDCGTTVTSDQRGVTRPAASACEKGSVEIAAFAPGPWSVGGRITTSDGNGIRNIIVTISGGGLATPLSAPTSAFGYYTFPAVPGGSYTMSVSSKRFSFTPNSRVVNVGSDLANENWVANPLSLGESKLDR